MIEAAVITLRLLQYAAGSILMGSALFVLYALPQPDREPLWTQPLLAWAAVALTASALLNYLAQTALFAGSWHDALTVEALGAVLGITLGKAMLVRAGLAALAALLLIAARPRRRTWLVSAVLGTAAVATFGWMGHGADSETWAQLVGDIIHVLTAATWIGALVAFLYLMRAPLESTQATVLHRALRKFSGVGVPLVALLTLSGLVNSWFLVGIDNIARLPSTDYGRLLLFKLAFFAGMLVLAALNRNQHAPAIGRTHGDVASVRAVRRSIALELGFGLAVLALVAWFGTLEPPINA